MPIEPIPLSEIKTVGEGLGRPEDVVVSKDGRVFVSHQEQLAELGPDGSVRAFGEDLGECNGINMLTDGRVVTTDYTTRGGVRAVDPDSGKVEVLAQEAAGRNLAYTNYPVVDSQGSIWVSCSTQHEGWLQAISTGADDGFIVRIDPDGSSSVVAEGVVFANGMALDADESYLYCCQTSPGNVVRFAINDDRTLGPKEDYGPPMGERRPDEYSEEAGMQAFTDPAIQRRWGLTDGCGFDQEGNLWVTVVTAGRISVITPDQELVTVIDDPEGEVVQMPTNVSWGGDGLTDLYIGTIGATRILKVTSPIPGLPLVHQR